MAINDSNHMPLADGVREMCESVCERPLETDATSVDDEMESLPRGQKPTRATPVKAATRQRRLAAVKHGLHLRAPSGLRLRARRTRRLAQKVRATLPWLQPSDEPAVKAWCELEYVTARLFADVLAKGEAGTTDLYRRVKTLQLAYERELGMTPASRAELGLTTVQAVNVAEQFAMLHARREEGTE
jgi:hypothetical protein